METITIDFNNRGDKVYKLESFMLSNSSSSHILAGLFRKEVKINYFSIGVDDLLIPEELEVKDPSKLVKLQCLQYGKEVESNRFQDLNIHTNELLIHVLLDESQILDCHAQDTVFRGKLSFKIAFQPKKNNPAKFHEITLELTCLRAESYPGYQLIIDEEYLLGKEYKGYQKSQIGYLEVYCKSDYKFSVPLEKCVSEIEFNIPNLKDAISFGEGITLDKSVELVSSNSNLQIQNLLPGQTLKVPIIVNFSRFKNPSDATLINGTLKLEYTSKGNIQARSQDFQIKILPDTKIAALYALFSTNNIDFRALKSREILSEKYIWKGKGKSGKTTCFYLQFGNIAESGQGGVQIRDFQINFYLHKDSASPILGLNEDLPSSFSDQSNLNAFFLINEQKTQDLQKSIFLANQIGGVIKFGIGFHHNLIGAIPKDIATILCKVAFKYHITTNEFDIENENPEFKPFISEIEFKLEKNLGDYWLALDFGTSAIVAAFTNGANITRNKEEELLVNLQEPLSQYISNYHDVEVNEKNTPFLSSEIILRPSNGKQKALINSTSYHNDIIRLSPSVDVSSQNLHLKIPFLKSLIGLDNIPTFSEKLEKYEYHLDENGEKFLFKDRPIKVTTVLANTYKSLIRDFIDPQIGDHEQLNKIIITVPNTFTPMHLTLIREIILEQFPKFRKDYIDFISESDAVACNYLLNWQEYNFERDVVATKNKDSEYVLVYDIGAGTTDLTYFRITQKNEVEKEVEIIGRLGKATAGNYLDFVIAKIIDQVSYTEDRGFNFTAPDSSQRFNAHILKILIRNIIKPSLANNQSLIIYIEPLSGRVSEVQEPSFIPFDCSKILDHENMQFYFERNSEQLINEFFSLFQKLPGEDQILEKGHVPIDTVIFTGRTIQFDGLRERVKDCIKDWSNREVYFTPLKAADELKNVVVKGALQFALHFRDRRFSRVRIKNRNLLARYGILYKDPVSFKHVFKEFLNPATQPINEQPVIVDGLTIYEYDTDKYNALAGKDPFIDLSATPTASFVQSFSSDTAADANEQNWEYITDMFKFTPHEVTTPSNIQKVKVRIVITAKNEMKVSIGNFDDGLNALLRMEIQDNRTFKESMWPYLWYGTNNDTNRW